MLINSSTEDLYKSYVQKMRGIADVRNAAAVLGWDQETYLPSKGATFRGQQLTTLSTIAHELFTDIALGELLQNLSQRENLSFIQQKNISLSLEDFQKNKKYSAALVAALSNATNECYHAWIKARRKNNFSIFSAPLANMIKLKKEEAEVLGYSLHPYNALLDEHEKGANVALLNPVFDDLKKRLSPLIRQIKNKPLPDNSFLHQHFEKNNQWQFGIALLKNMGYDFDAGRQDISEHPFTTSFNRYDVRITTRIDENDFNNMTWSCIHEGGHALYEQGLPAAEYGLPSGEAASLGIHESQSRLWENNIGRSKSYWHYHYPTLQKIFPAQLKNISLENFYRAINTVHPSLIRTEADELTYHFHVMIRYEIEKLLMEGNIGANDLAAAWNNFYKDYLGIEVTDDLHGVLQDVHWSHGSIGYFPTYSLGSLYAAQFFAKASEDIPGLQQQIENGNTLQLLEWLRKNIHQYGRIYTAEELCTRITGKGLQADYFIEHANKKYEALYNLE